MRRTWHCLLTAGLLAWSAAANPDHNPVSNGSFELLGDDGVAVDWEHVGASVDYSERAHSGARSLRLSRQADQPGEVGLNRAWTPESGEGGAMLTVRHGAIEFWYQLVNLRGDCDLQLLTIPMDDSPFERTSSPRGLFVAPRRHVGDRQWHRAVVAFDYTADPTVRWVHVAARLTGAGSGEVLLDSIRWLPEAGPLPRLDRLRVVPSSSDWDHSATLVALVINDGDRPAEADLSIDLSLPPGLTVGEPDASLAGLGPRQARRVTWPLVGRRPAGAVTASLRAVSQESVASVTLAADLRLQAALAAPALPRARQPVECEVVVDSLGLAAARPVVWQRPDGPLPAGPSLVPLQRDEAEPWRWRGRWRLTAGPEYAQTVRVEVSDGDRLLAAGTIVMRVMTDQEPRWEPAGGGLEVAATTLGLIGRLRDGETTLATLPHLGQVLLEFDDHREVGYPTRLERHDGRLIGYGHDSGGGQWLYRWLVSPGAGPGHTRIDLTVTCDQPRRVLALHGPDLYADGQRREALLCGVEWLAAGELSSNDRDIASDHPHRLRLTPHPNMVTIPAAAAVTDRGLVGLLWEAGQIWLGEHDRPQPVFASPDRWTGRSATRFGLMAPSVLTGLTAGSLTAEQPLLLAAGQPVRFQATLLGVAGETDVLQAVTAWLTEYQPAPLPDYPRGSVEAELAFSARAYLESLWDEATGRWWNFRLGPAVMRSLTDSPSYVFDLHQFARLVPRHPLAAAAERRAEEVAARSGRPPEGRDGGYFAGTPAERLLGRLAEAPVLLASADPDGGWSYQPPLPQDGVFRHHDYFELGLPGEQGNGLFAARLREVLRPARLVGDRQTYREALPSLERLASFGIPRAAQVWEVPVHAPDILAAAEAVEAFCEAYQLSGEERWLAAARRQALAGLTFVYVWNAPDRPWMRYGSIPVLGATWRQGSWFGRVVQWNGLRLAQALLQLSHLDSTTHGELAWSDWAKGLMLSAMAQQQPDGELVALWPDYLDTITGERCPWEFAPRHILEVCHELLGRPELPRTSYLQPGDTAPRTTRPDHADSVAVSACAAIDGAAWADSGLSVTVRQPVAPAAVRLTVSGLARPAAVLVDGQAAPARGALAGAASGWAWSPLGGILTVVLPPAATATVTVPTAVASELSFRPERVGRVAFEFNDGETAGWLAQHQVEQLAAHDGRLHLVSTGGDPYLVRPGCQIDGATVQVVGLRLRSAAGGPGQFYWTTATAPQFSEERAFHFNLTAGEWAELTLPVGGHPGWDGELITSLRLDPGSGPGPVEIDYLRGR